MNGTKALEELYHEVRPRLLELPRDLGLSAPHFISPPEAFWRAARRVLVVGQETRGWGPVGATNLHDEGAGVRPLMDCHREFGLGNDLTHTPFWKATRDLRSRLQDYGVEVTVSNLAKLDQNGSAPDPSVMQRLIELKIVPREIDILRPHHVVFFVGPSRESVLRDTLGDRVPRWNRPITEFSLSGGTPATWTYHPLYLRLSRQQEVLDDIVRRVRASFARGA